MNEPFMKSPNPDNPWHYTKWPARCVLCSANATAMRVVEPEPEPRPVCEEHDAER